MVCFWRKDGISGKDNDGGIWLSDNENNNHNQEWTSPA